MAHSGKAGSKQHRMESSLSTTIPRESLNGVAADSALASRKTLWTGRSVNSSLSGRKCEAQVNSVFVLLECIVH